MSGNVTGAGDISVNRIKNFPLWVISSTGERQIISKYVSMTNSVPYGDKYSGRKLSREGGIGSTGGRGCNLRQGAQARSPSQQGM